MMFDFLALIGAFLPTWVIVLLMAVAAFFIVLLIIKFIGFVLHAIPFL